MKQRIFPHLSKIYIFLISASIIPVLITANFEITSYNIVEMLFWIGITVAAEFKPIFINKSDEVSEITLSFAAHLPCMILLGIEKTLWIVIISTFIVETIQKRTWYKTLFNLGQIGLTLLLSNYFFDKLKFSPENVPIDIFVDMPAILVSSTIYIIFNTFFISAIIYLVSNEKFLDIFLTDFKIVGGYYYSLVPISIAITYIYDPGHMYVILVMVPPLILMDQSVRRYYKLHSEARSTLSVLADIIDHRDKYTFDHSTRVAKYAKQIAEQLNLSTSEINRIETAGLVHDLGKISIEDKVINKNGKLTDEEFAQIKSHPETAYRLLKNLQPYENGAEYVLYHHERFDGKGYPKGVSGEKLPLGARILTVADSYDAMTTDRPYREAMTIQQAVGELTKHSGTQFDPCIVEAFVEVLKRDYGYNKEGESSCS